MASGHPIAFLLRFPGIFIIERRYSRDVSRFLVIMLFGFGRTLSACFSHLFARRSHFYRMYIACGSHVGRTSSCPDCIARFPHVGRTRPHAHGIACWSHVHVTPSISHVEGMLSGRRSHWDRIGIACRAHVSRIRDECRGMIARRTHTVAVFTRRPHLGRM